MNAIMELHHKAMELADEAVVASFKGKTHTADFFYEKAFLLEKEAALNTPADDSLPVARHVLMRSAVALAQKAGLFQEAEKLATLCLTENPEDFIVQELQSILKQIQSEEPAFSNRHFQIDGIITHADAKESEIKVEDLENQRLYSILVPSDKLDEIVTKFWKHQVNIEARVNPHGVILLEKITMAA